MPTQPLRVLVVEDSADDAALMLLELQRGGYAPAAERVETAAAFRAALAAGAWDVILCDNSLPEFDPSKALDILRQFGADVPLIVVSGTIGEERAVELMRAGAADFVMKGNLARLAAAVEREARQAGERRERRRAEREARDLAAIVASSDDAIIGKALDGTITSWNAGAERLFGYAAPEVVGRNASFLVPPDRRGEKSGLMGRLARGERVDQHEEVRVRKDGTPVHVSVSLSPVRDDAGRVVGASVIARDITLRKRADERQVRDALLLANVRDAVVVTDVGGVVTYWNDGAERLFGWTAAETVGRPYADRYPEPDRAFIVDGIRRRVAGEEWAGEYEDRRKDGSRVWIDARVTRITDPAGEVVGVLGLSHDITPRKRAEEELRRASDLLRAVADGTPDAVFVKDRAGRYLLFNAAACRFVGKAAGDVLGRDDTALFGPADARRVMDRDRRVMESGRGETDEEVLTAAGATRTYLATKAPYRDGHGGVVGLIGISHDVTDRKAAEVALRASEARKAAILDTALDCIITMDHEGNVVEFNTAAERTFGYRRDEVVGKQLAHLIIPPSLRERHRLGMAHYLATGEGTVMGRRLVFPARRADGTEFPAELAITRIPTDGPPLFTAYLRDITDQERAGAERAERARLAALVVDVGLALSKGGELRGVLGLCAAAVVRHLDAAFARIWTLNESEGVLELQASEGMYTHLDGPHGRVPVGKFKIGLIAQERRPHLTNAVVGDDRVGDQEWATREGMAAFAGYPLLVGPRLVGVIALFSRQPLSDATLQSLAAIADQIALGIDRRRAEHALLLRDRAIRAVVGGIVITDATAPDNPISYVSPGFEHLTGYAAAEAVGRNCRFLQGKDTDPAAVAEVREAVRRGVPCDAELLNYRKDGTTFWNALSISPVRDDAGRLTNFIGVQTDVTGRRKLENQFHQAQKMEAVGQLAGGVAHDFNNLLTVINGYGEIVHDALPPGHPSRELVAEIRKAGDRAAGLTRQLLAFSRQAVLEAKVLDPNALVRDVETMLRRLIGEDIDLATRLAPDVGRVKADPGQLEQAVVNLCVNARDAMPQGGKLTVETRNVELDAAYVATHPDVRPGPYVVLAVSDTGAGMTPEVRARIFEPFFTTKESGKGTGLGLAMVFGFVQQSGGHVAVYSEQGRGTAFKLYLPRVDDAPAAGKSGVHRTLMPRGTETVLLVEDEPAVRTLGRHVLVMCGYAVLEAGNGREAVKAADGHAGPVHIVVTDVVMPGGMGGRQVAEAVLARHPAAGVLYTSGYTDDAVVRHGVLEAGVHFLQKPFTPAALAQKVRDVLDGKG